MPKIPANTVGSIRQNEKGQFELLAPGGKQIFSAPSEVEAREFAGSVLLPLPEGFTSFEAPQAPTGQIPPVGGQTPQGGQFGAETGVSPLTQQRAQLPGPNEFTNLLKNVVDVKLGRKPFIIGIPDEDMKLLTPSAVRQELGRRANDLLAQGADVSAIMQSYQGMYQDTLNVADKYLRDLEKRQDMLRDFAFSEAVLTNGVLPKQLDSILSPEEKAIWGQMSSFYKTEFQQKKSVSELIAKDIDPATGEATLVFRNPFTGEITRKTLEATRTPDKQLVLDMVQTYPDAGILPTDTLQQAQAKLPKSRIYQDKVRVPIGRNNKKEDDDINSTIKIPTFEEWLDVLQQQNQMTFNLGDPRVKSDLESKFQKFIDKNFPSGGTDPTKILTTIDKQKMIAQGLNPNNREDALQFIRSKNTENTISDIDNLEDDIDRFFSEG